MKKQEDLVVVKCSHCGRVTRVAAEHLRTPYYCC
jgi:hypothetical protein